MTLDSFPPIQFASSETALYQYAFVVRDLAQAVEAWAQHMNVGPFFTLDHWGGENAVYRELPSHAQATHAFSSSGGLSIELIRPEDDLPSVFQDTIRTRGYGLQHVGYVSAAFEADTAALVEQGFRVIFHTESPIGPYRFLSSDALAATVIELCDGTKQMHRTFQEIQTASIEWDGSDPLRSFTRIEQQ